MSRLYTVKALAERYEKDEETIRRWCNDGDTFPNAFKIKEGWYVPEEDIVRLEKRYADRSEKPVQPKRQPKNFVRGW